MLDCKWKQFLYAWVALKRFVCLYFKVIQQIIFNVWIVWRQHCIFQKNLDHWNSARLSCHHSCLKTCCKSVSARWIINQDRHIPFAESAILDPTKTSLLFFLYFQILHHLLKCLSITTTTGGHSKLDSSLFSPALSTFETLAVQCR